MTITYVWSDVRDRAVEAFGGELPGAEVENATIEVFGRRPALVVATIEAVAEAKQAGSIRSGWAILRTRLRDEEARAEISVTDESDQRKRVSRAEQWIRAAGKHFDSESEVVDELFGERGLLRGSRDDLRVRTRMVSLWREVRSEGEQIEREAIERAERWKEPRGQVPGHHGYPVTRLQPLPKKSEDADPEPELDPEPVLA